MYCPFIGPLEHASHTESLSLVHGVAFNPGLQVGFEQVLHVLLVLLKYLVDTLQTKSHEKIHLVSGGLEGHSTQSVMGVPPGRHAGAYLPNPHDEF